MCTLTEPAPTLFIDWLHPDPSVLLIWGLAGTFVFGLLLLVVWASPDGKDTSRSRKQASLLMLAGYVCSILLLAYWGGVFGPYSNALEAWYQREQGVLSQECVSTVLTPAYEAARNMFDVRFGSAAIILFGLGGLCVGVAAFSRNLIYPSKLGLAKRLNRHIF